MGHPVTVARQLHWIPSGMNRISSRIPAGGYDLGIHHGSRRAARRFVLDAQVELLEPCEGHGLVLNASAGGLRVAVDHPVAIGAHCLLRITTPGRAYIEHARVIWRQDHPDGHVLGLEFVDSH